MYTSVPLIHLIIRIVFTIIFSALSVCTSLILFRKLQLLKYIRTRFAERRDVIRCNFATIFINPFFEEIVFRYGIYTIINTFHFTFVEKSIIFVSLSSLIFALAHIPRRLIHFVEKFLVGGVQYSSIYLWSKDIVLVIAIHMFHNFMILLLQNVKEERDKGKNAE